MVSSQDPGSALAAYAALYVEQEVRAEGLARDVGSFSRFLEAAAFSHAATLNVSELARECETSRTTVAGYLELLEDLLLSFRLPVFTRRARRRLVAHPRFFYFDCGVYRSLRPAGPLDRPTEKAGPALEGLVAQHLRAWLAYSRADAGLYYWRTRGGAEVDLVIYGAAGFWAFDVVNADRIRPADLRGLTSFGDEYPEARRVLLYRGSRRGAETSCACRSRISFAPSIRNGDWKTQVGPADELWIPKIVKSTLQFVMLCLQPVIAANVASVHQPGHQRRPLDDQHEAD